MLLPDFLWVLPLDSLRVLDLLPDSLLALVPDLPLAHQNDHAVQIEAVRGFIEQELDYICIAPIQSAGWDTVLQEAKDAGIPVLIVDRAVDADPSLYTTALGCDMVAEGEAAGNWLAEYLNGEDANILVTASPACNFLITSSAKPACKGLHSTLQVIFPSRVY